MPGPDRSPTRGRQAARERIAAKRAAEQEAERLRRRRRGQLIAGITVAVVVVAAVLVTVLVQSARTDTADAVAPANTAAGTAETGFAVGSPGAPVTVDVYEDYLCPACRAFEESTGDTLDQLVADGEVLVRYRPVAILDRFSDDAYSTRAANAAAVVADTAGADAFHAFSESLFAQQPAENGPGLTDDELIDAAAQAGAQGDDVAAAIRDLRFGDWVASATDRASRDGLTGTPRILVDGEPLEAPTAEALSAAVEAAQG
ncbi:thioredoxin domain-containing protein [Blastococcus sp. URHD0036]|uniref:DsbA family protein n=1 Tax=Blastococcus sp. URHD0036 TaxID=1380356 RepID=UPI00068A5393|nr:thioredoxin domain-containing protein [Blastococcus sp. URHD0036]